MYIRAHKTVFSTSNIYSGKRAASLYPLYPNVVLDKVRTTRMSSCINKTNHNLPIEVYLDTLLLDSSLPDSTKLR